MMGRADMPAGVRNWLYKIIPNLITGKGRDFSKEYGLKAKDLEAQIAQQMSSRGLLSSSAMGSAMGGGLADLMLGRAGMEQESREFNAMLGTKLWGLGREWQEADVSRQFDFADYLGKEWEAKQRMRVEGLDYQVGQQEMRQDWDMGMWGLHQGAKGGNFWEQAAAAGTQLGAAAITSGLW